MSRWVQISFDCLPLRSVGRLDVPLDASPKLAEKIYRIKRAVETHGSHNTYYLHNASCCYHLTNDEQIGMLLFRFEGTIFTDANDLRALHSDLQMEVEKETCDWLNQQIVDWLIATAKKAVLVEFDRYIQAGDLAKTRERMAQVEKLLEDKQGYVGMYL